MKKINVITLGCSKNTVDSEHLMARLAAAGYEVRFDSDRTDAKVVVINTCGFIGDAKQESVEMILRAAEARKAGKIECLFVIGCLSERYADDLRSEIPEVDEYFGARTWDGIVRALGAAEDPALATERHLTTPKHYAYLKISEGCNWKCGYCAIPLIRGPHVSVPMEVLEEEARKLAAQGVRELIVIAQDTTYYGLDLYGKRRIAELLRRLCRANGMDRSKIKLHVVQDDEVNAFACPGNHLVVYTALIDSCRSAEELCGVLAHELAHIERGHVMQKLIKEMGLAALTGLVGGNAGAATMAELMRVLSSTAYDRSLESEADDLAVTYLLQAGINPRPFGEFLFRLSEEEELPSLAEWVSTHPDSGKRSRLIGSRAEREGQGRTFIRLMQPAEWDAYRKALREKKEALPASD